MPQKKTATPAEHAAYKQGGSDQRVIVREILTKQLAKHPDWEFAINAIRRALTKSVKLTQVRAGGFGRK